MRYFQQNESNPTRRVLYFEMVDAAGDPLTGLSPAVEILKAGQTTYSAFSGTIFEVGHGTYMLLFDATHLSTQGIGMLRVTAPGAAEQKIPFQVLESLPVNVSGSPTSQTQRIFGAKRGAAFSFVVTLESVNGGIKTTPTIATGDFKLSIDGSPLSNLASNPVETPAGSGMMVVSLTQAEMSGDRIVVRWVDQAGNEWRDGSLEIITRQVTVDELVRSTVPANTLDVASTGEVGIDFTNVKQPASLTTLSNVGLGSVDKAQNVFGVATGAIAATSFAGGALTGNALAADAVKKIWDQLKTASFAANSLGGLIYSVLSNLEAYVVDGLIADENDLAGLIRALASTSGIPPASWGGFLKNRHSLQAAGDQAYGIGYSGGDQVIQRLIDAQNDLTAVKADIYTADIDYAVDEAASKDEYTVSWFRNGVLLKTGVTNAKISAFKRADGAALINQAAMTAVGATGVFRYDASAGERQPAGDAVIVDAEATIDGSTRTWRRLFSRDSA